MRAAVRTAWTEITWWFRCTRALLRFPGHVAIAVAVVWFAVPWLSMVWFLVPVTTVVAVRCWALAEPASFQWLVLNPARMWWRRQWMRRHWLEVAEACGLGVLAPRRQIAWATAERLSIRPSVTVPRLVSTRSEGLRLVLTVRPALGQTFEDIERAGEQLRTAVAASRVRIDPDGPNAARVTLTVGDSLTKPFDAHVPTNADVVTDRVWLGRTESGADWWLPVGPHTLVAGCSGAGKGSVFWSFAFGLATGVRRGTVRLHGIDLKGGMEILMGDGLFTTRATNAAEAAVLLEDLVHQMWARTAEYAGRIRSHSPTVEQPLQVVMIDELAALTAYCPERDLQRRSEMAINLLCSQGRAPGFMVLACLQDPRKEVIPSRGLFTQMIGLRLKDLNETAMVLGETAVTSGAHCHRISRTAPGTGYVVPEEGGYPVRVRAGYASDQMIRAVAAEFGSPVHQTLVVPEPTADEGLPSARRPRTTRGSAVA